MRNRHRTIFRVAAILPLAALAACGGGGSNSSTPTTRVTVAPTATAAATEAPDTCSSVSGYRRRVAKLAGTNWVNPNRLYVSYKASAASRVVMSVDQAVNATNSHDFGITNGVGHRVITLPSSTTAAAATATLKASSDVTNVESVHYRVPISFTSGTDAVNDPLSDNVDQWYLYITNADPGGWGITTGSSAVSVAVLDTGVDLTNTDLPVKYSESDVGGVTTVGGTAAQDTQGHGTNVAGLATATANNSNGFAGYGYSTSLQAYRIFPDATSTSDCQSADTADEALAIQHAITNGASVINLSLGAPASEGVDSVEKTAVEAAITAGVTVVAANGNEYTSGGTASDYPAGYPGVIAVGASAVTDDNVGASYSAITAETVASYSNSGPTLVAPGGDANGDQDQDILHWIEGYSTTTAAYPPDQCVALTGKYAPYCIVLFNGTSQATPQVSGTIALMEANHGGSRSLTPAQVKAKLIAKSDLFPNISTTRQGAGRLDVAKAVAAPIP